MKYLRSFLLFLSAAFIISSCQKELSFEEGTARGSLKKASGDCLGANQVGTFKKDTLLTAGNYVDIQVDIIQTGTYVIKTDTLNGYSFSATGIVAVEGVNTIRLLASGRPVAPALDVFTVKFDTTSCQINIVVNGTGGGGGTVAQFTLNGSGSPTSCTGAAQTNNFYATIPTNASNTVTVYANVTTPGSYSIQATTTPANGLTFTGSGNLAFGANVPIVLQANGQASTAGSIPYSLTSTTPASNCGFNLTVQAAPTPATYTFNCATANVQGAYQANSAMTVANKMTIDINVTTAGSYNITTTMNGVTFAKAGVLPATPAVQTITLDATGTAGATVGVVNFILAGGGGPNCSVPVTFTAASTPASYTFNCPTANVLGTYQANSAMTPANTMTIDVTVTAGGPYTITTTMNGVTFSKSSTLPATPAVQTITLNATGTSGSTVGNVDFTLTGGGGPNCVVPVTFTAASANGSLSFVLGTVTKTFNFVNGADTSVQSFPPPLPPGSFFVLSIGGDAAAPPSPESFFIDIVKQAPYFSNGSTYNLNQLAQIIILDVVYTDNSGDDYTATTDGTTQIPNFSVTINSITATNVTGIFSGTLKNATGTAINITSGSFNLPLQ